MQREMVRKITRTGFRLAALSAVALLIAGTAGAAVEKPAAAGTVKGMLSGQEWKAPVENVVVRMLDIATGKEYLSAPTDRLGMFEISGVSEGRYRVEAVSADGVVDLKRSVLVMAGEVAEMSLRVGQGVLTPEWDNAQGVYGMMETMCPPPHRPSPWTPPGKPPWVPGPPPWQHKSGPRH